MGGSLLPLRQVSFSAICARSQSRNGHTSSSYPRRDRGGRDAGLGALVNSQMRAAGQGPKRNRDAGGSRSHQKRLHPKARHFSEPTLLTELERRAASAAGRLRGRMGRPHLEDPARGVNPGCGQGSVRGGNDHRHLLGRGRRSPLSLPPIPPTSGPRSPQHQPRLESQGVWASRQRAFPFTCAGEWEHRGASLWGCIRPQCSFLPPSTPGPLIFPLLLPSLPSRLLDSGLKSLKWWHRLCPPFPSPPVWSPVVPSSGLGP